MQKYLRCVLLFLFLINCMCAEPVMLIGFFGG